jgi:hypothetical protein
MEDREKKTEEKDGHLRKYCKNSATKYHYGTPLKSNTQNAVAIATVLS